MRKLAERFNAKTFVYEFAAHPKNHRNLQKDLLLFVEYVFRAHSNRHCIMFGEYVYLLNKSVKRVKYWVFVFNLLKRNVSSSLVSRLTDYGVPTKYPVHKFQSLRDGEKNHKNYMVLLYLLIRVSSTVQVLYRIVEGMHLGVVFPCML